MDTTSKPWDGSAARYDDAQDWCNACLIDANPAGKPKAKALWFVASV